MKKNMIAVMLSLVIAVGSVGGVSAFAVETTAVEANEIIQEEAVLESDTAEENEDADIDVVTEDVSEDEPAQAEEEDVTEEYAEEAEEESDQETEEAADESKTAAAAEEVSIGQEDASVAEITSETTDEAEEISDVSETPVEIIESTETAVIEEEIITEEENDAALAADVWLWPFSTSQTITSGFRTSSRPDHDGVDIGANIGDPIYAVNDGTIYKKYEGCNQYGAYGVRTCQSAGVCSPNHGYYSGYCNNGYGNGICLKTKDGYYVQFAHMQSVNSSLYEGQYIAKGTLLGYVGGSGMATGKHCHYAVATGGEFSGFVNPMNMNYTYGPYVVDTEPPVVRNARITDVSKDGYTVICDVSDNVGVTRVTFPTWTNADWQDDIVWKDGTISNGTATFRVNISDHGNQLGEYLTYIYASDAAGNVSVETDAVRLHVILQDAPPKNPTITVSKSHYLPTDTIRIQANADGATSYYGAIYRLGTRIWEGYCQDGGVIEYPASQYGQGEYSAYVTCSNNAGWVDTKWVNYTVPYDMGNDFYAYIILLKDWRHLGLSGTNIEIASSNDSLDPKQIWRFIKQSDGSYIAYNMYMSGYENSDWVLSCNNSGSTNQTNIEVAKNQSLSSQKWFVYVYDNQYKLVPTHCSLAMDAVGGSSESGTNIQLYESNEGSSQRFSVYKLSNDNRTYTRPGKPSASVYTGPTKTDAGKTVTLTWTESPKVNSFDLRSYCLRIYDSTGKEVLNKSGLTATSYNYTFSTAGTYSVQITAVNDYLINYETAGSKAQITASEVKKDLSSLTITGIVNKTYTGKAVTQKVVLKDGEKTLNAGTDYTVSYKNNKNVGTATIVITGNGNYTGTVEKTFKITAKKITPTIAFSKTSFVYNGKPQIPEVTVNDGNTVLADKDFDITWPLGCQNAGEYEVTVTLKGNYSGTATGTFLILPGKTTRGDMFNLANNVKVTWKEVPGAKYYKVYREGVTDPDESLSEPVIVTERLIGWDQQPGLTNGHAYRYKIVASLTGKGDSSGDSPLSYSKLMYRLKTVVIRSVKNTAPGKVTVKYDKTTSGDSYVLQYCEREDMVGAKTKVVLGANNTSYTIGGLTKGKTYYISIRVRKKVDGIDYYTTFGVAKKIKITQ